MTKLAVVYHSAHGHTEHIAGDKQSTLQSMFVFAMQHGMIWVGNPIIPEQHGGVPYDQAANRLGSWSGLMAQAGHSAAADSFAPGDIKTARMFGRNFAESLHRISSGGHATQEKCRIHSASVHE